SGINDSSWSKLKQFFIFPDIGFLVPIIFGIKAAIVDDQSGRITYFTGAPQFDYIFIQRSNGNVVFDSRMAIHDHAHIMEESRTTLWHDIDALLPSCLDHLLPLIP